MNYKRFSVRFIKYITNKKAREYNSYGNYSHHRFIYEGEYLMGKDMEKEKNTRMIMAN